MAEELETVSRYREHAEQLRLLADVYRREHRRTAETLRRVAEKYERMAENVDRRDPTNIAVMRAGNSG